MASWIRKIMDPTLLSGWLKSFNWAWPQDCACVESSRTICLTNIFIGKIDLRFIYTLGGGGIALNKFELHANDDKE